jgi:hypothetical protein
MNRSLKTAKNGEAFSLAEIPHFEVNDFLQKIITETGSGWRVLNLFGIPDNNDLTLYAVLGARHEHQLGIMKCTVSGSFPSITSAAASFRA